MSTETAHSTHPTWKAPHADGPVDAQIRLPGSKSQTNRALVIAALSAAPSTIRGGLMARDTELMIDALRGLGVGIDIHPDRWQVNPGPFGSANINTGLAGTVMRFLPPLAALAHGVVHFDGDLYARERPMSTLLDGMRMAGITVDDQSRGRLPFAVYGIGHVAGGRVLLDSSASSQFVSGLLLSGARYDAGIEVLHIGHDPVPSAPHIEMTLQALRAAGVDARATSATSWRVAPGRILAPDVLIEPDLSNAAPFLAAALVTGGRVSVPDWPTTTNQGGDELRELLERLGADVTLEDGTLTVQGTGKIRGIDVDLTAVSELSTVIAALAALADSPSHLTGLAHTRGHETDRLAALHADLAALGCGVHEHHDGLTITPKPLHAGLWRAHADHRMATAGALLGLSVPGVEIDDIACTSKTLPDFVGLWTRLLTP
ncbi:3-phosphoshikimate 1-carboxyvinyltransferase [Jatrophihabitans sp. GAS493]|uniref:3-phosphoshikimate 1-carboxyvinyltransferase n=1 Tax=Jatrophihabitans sp. GAS493 TaxID=1907575 RepID=UPI000BB857EB|nr:3-phosphoshikimate 1-carboxyvinyltransferase [Jatrophihabitans sp. GAS493]SOD73244.1 3-phosphoshikimate 1-carboxyvinyltransferase [Jatrophihabitans sp. GAS493]